MPFLKIQINQSVEPNTHKALLRQVSQLVSAQIGKPERYLMAAMESGMDMIFGADTAPCAFLELKRIGLSERQTTPLSEALCAFVAAELNVPKDRGYVKFESVTGAMWGWNGGTF